MKGYIIANSFASPSEREAIDKINRWGGIDHHVRMGNIIVGMFVVLSLALYVTLWTTPPAVFVPVGVTAGVVGAVFYFRYYRLLGDAIGKAGVATNHPELIALDKEWRALVSEEPDEHLRAAEDQKRFVNLRRLTLFTPPEDVKAQAEQLRSQLRPNDAES